MRELTLLDPNETRRQAEELEICYAIEAHLTNQHSQTRGVCLSA
jgi:hypothetical protein